jgi:hypothetical protein
MRRFSRKIIRISLLLLLFAAIAPFAYPLKDGKPLLSLERLSLPSLPALPLPKADPEPVTAYKWRDEQGNWHFAGEPPQGIAYQRIELDPQSNLIPGAGSTPQAAKETAEPGQAAQSGDGGSGFGYTPEQIGAVMEKAREASAALEAHHRAVEGALQ